MTPERWQRMRPILDRALDLHGEERAAFLDERCSDDASLRADVETLLRAEARGGPPLDEPVGEYADDLVADLAIRERPLSGHVVSHYEVLGRLGGGGMGVVYRARDTRLDRIVALKFLSAHLSSDGEAKERFLVEARAAAALDHPNICTIHEIGETEAGELFLAMPFYSGETLGAMLGRGALPLDQVLSIATQVADGLERAHWRSIVHRDIKPANLIVTGEGVVKILDFGVAKLVDLELTRPGVTPGTVAYMSPEQAEGAQVDHRSDLWALGVVLYEMLAGERPFQGPSDAAVRNAIVNAAPAPIAHHRPDAPAALERVVAKALARRPEDRYGSAGELAAELRAITEGGTRGARVARPSAERCRAVVVVSSLAGYAALVERLGPEDAERLIASIHAAAADVARHQGGVIHRLDVEEMTLAFGVPATHEDDAIQAVRAALELHARVGRLIGAAPHAATDGVALHTGVDTGSVIAQPIGDQERGYNVAGTPVNVAAHLSMHVPANEVWLSPACYRMVEAHFEVERRAALPARDRARPLVPFRVIRESGPASRLDTAQKAGLTTYTGRDAELDALQRAFSEARAGEGRLVTVVGDAGMGKSRLLHEFREGLADRRVLLLNGRCHSYGSNTAYFPFIQMLTGWFALGEIEDRGARRDAVVDAVREMDTELEEFIPLVLHLLSIASDEFPVPRHLHGNEFGLAMQDALTALFTVAARQRPSVLFLEDWHWADEASRAVLLRISDVIASHPLLVVTSYRPGHGVAFDSDADLTSLLLRPLDLGSCLAMLRSVLQVEAVPEPLARLLHERTGGNPFFVEEICQALREDGTIRVEGSTAVFDRSTHVLELPDTVQAVIRARLDRLDTNARDVMRLAAVIGRDFSRGLLEQTVPDRDRSLLPRALESLKAAGLIQQRTVVPEPRYRFKHVLTQEVAYASLLEHQRLQLHARVGEALERLSGASIENELDRLVHHFSRAERWDRAVQYGLRAAERARALAQFTDALRRLEQSQHWLRDLPEDNARRNILIDILLDQERLCETLGLRGRQQAIIDELIRLLDPARELPKLAETYVRQGDLFTLLRRFDEAEAALAKSLSTYREMKDAVGERNALRSLGLLRWHQDRNHEALDAIEEALTIDRERRDTEAIVGDLVNRASVLKSVGELDRAKTCLEEAWSLSEGGASDGSAADIESTVISKRHQILNVLANVHREEGDTQHALELLERAAALGREKRQPIQASFHYTGIAHVLLQAGRIDDSLRYYHQAVELTRRAKYTPGLAQALRMLGNVLLGLGRQEEALPVLEEAARLFAQLEDREAEALMWRETASAHERGSRYAEALAAWSKVRSLRRQRDDGAGELEALEGIARVTRRHVDEPSLALGYYLEALALAQRFEDPGAEGRLRNSIAILEWERGDYAEALRHYERGLDMFRRLGDDANVGLILGSIGATFTAMNRWSEARAPLDEAITLHRGTGQRQLEAYALGTLGETQRELGAIDEAIACFEASLAIRREIGDRRGEAWMLHHLARANLARRFAEQADPLIARAENIALEIDDAALVTACERLRRERGP